MKMIIDMKAVIEKVVSFALRIYANPNIKKAEKYIALINTLMRIKKIDDILSYFNFPRLLIKIRRPVRVLLKKNSFGRYRAIYLILCHSLRHIVVYLAFKVIPLAVSILIGYLAPYLL